MIEKSAEAPEGLDLNMEREEKENLQAVKKKREHTELRLEVRCLTDREKYRGWDQQITEIQIWDG